MRTSEVLSQIDAYKDVAVYDNGPDRTLSQGPHHCPNTGYYFGQKWQCVEFVKRFYHQALGHAMPNVWGHAKSFFDPQLPSGTLNSKRGLIQFCNAADEPPRADDLLVFTDTYHGHVSIITQVHADWIETIQQNNGGVTRERLSLAVVDDTWTLAGARVPAGWLRLPEKGWSGAPVDTA